MGIKVVVGICLALVLVEAILGAPHNSRREQDLQRSFVEFLQQDKELAAFLQTGNLGAPTLTRNVRQAEGEFSKEENGTDIDPESKPGFFDRAAKFVMEVLQRFLKWVNTDN